MQNTVRSRVARFATAAALAVAMLATLAAGAFAAPSEPTLGLAALDAKLAAAPGGVIRGYMKTVLKGDTISNVPVDVLAVTDGQGTAVSGGVILFEALGPDIDKAGGIVAGMSGSPIYVNDGGVDKVVGALAYGQAFTLSGMGLATPIEAMARLETAYPATGLYVLGTPLVTSTGVKSTVVVTPQPGNFTAAAAGGTLVMRPLTSFYVGGISPTSSMYQRLKASAEKNGFSLVPATAPFGTQTTYSGPLVPGSSVAALFARGDVWMGGIGTVTYTNGSNIACFGHPLLWEGPSGLYMANAWVDGIWPNSIQPFKVARPGAIRGTFTQDRSVGDLAVIGRTTTETPVTARATLVETGLSANSSAWLPAHVVDSAGSWFQGIVPSVAYRAGSLLFDASSSPGSALTTTTVVVNDGTKDYTIKFANMSDSAYDIPGELVADVWTITSELENVNGNGIANAHIVSVDLESRISAKRARAEVIDVQAPNGLAWGDNRVTVTLAQAGVKDDRTVDVTLTIPAGTPLTGELSALGTGDVGAEGGDPSKPDAGPGIDRRTVADVVAELGQMVPRNQLVVSYQPGGGVTGMNALADTITATKPVAESVAATVSTSWVVGKSVTKPTSLIEAEFSRRTITYGSTLYVAGQVMDATSGTVELWRRYSGDATETLVATATVGDTGSFMAAVSGLERSAVVRIYHPGTAENLASQARYVIRVAPRIRLSVNDPHVTRGTRVRFAASLRPATVTGGVVIERRVGTRWVRIALVTPSGGTARAGWTPPVGTHTVRARYLGGDGIVPGVSAAIQVVVR